MKTSKNKHKQKELNNPDTFGRIGQKPSVSGESLVGDLISGGLIQQIGAGVNLYQNPGFDTPHLRKHNVTRNFFVGILPHLIQDGFKAAFVQKFPEYAEEGKGTTFYSGHMHPDNVFFSRLSSLRNLSQFPDILVTQDINTLFHLNNKVLNSQNFEAFNPVFNDCYEGSGIAHPYKIMRFLASDVLVMVVDKTCWGNKALPRDWYELLSPQLENSLVFCADTDFPDNTMYLHFVRDFGIGVITQLSRNTLCRMHPSEMLLSLEGNNKVGAAVYVMPYSWARLMSTHADYSIVWPEDGAIALPVQLLVKKGFLEQYRDIIRFLTGTEMGEFFRDNGFISTNPRVMHPTLGRRINWLGWDFINSGKLSELKNEIHKLLDDNE